MPEIEIITTKAKQVRNEYMRQYRKRNPEKIREINRRYWERRASREQEAQNNEKQDDQIQNG